MRLAPSPLAVPRPRARRWTLAAILAASAHAVVAAPASADAGHHATHIRPLAQTLTGSAKADYDAAKLLFGDGDFAGARIKFQSAYDTAKDARLLWNIATCQKAERHYAKVVALLKRYEDEGGALLTPADVKEAQDLILALEPFTVKVTFKVSEDAAEVSVDGELVGTTPLPPVVVDIGERRVRVTKEGFVPFEKAFPVGGAEATIDARLEKVIHEGRIVVNAPAGAAVFLDDKQVGVGKVDETVASGGHQVRIVGPGMRPYASEVVILDKETRTLDVSLESLELPKVRVAVGCGDAEPKSPDEGLLAYLDGNDVLPPSGTKRSWDAERNENVFRYAEYPASPGPHTLRIRATGCVSVDRAITVDPVNGDDVLGALQLDKNTLLKGPQGTPGWGRVGVAFWMPTLIGQYGLAPDSYGGHAGSYAGVAVDAGLVRRWFSADLAFGYASGSLTRTSFGSNYALPANPASDIVRGILRLGPRFPFHTVSLGLGGLAGVEQVNVDGVKTGGVDPTFGGYVELVVQPFCTFGFFAMGEANVDIDTSSNANNSGNGNAIGFASLQIGTVFEPSSACKKERNTAFGLRERMAEVPRGATTLPAASPSSVGVTAPPAAVPASAPAPVPTTSSPTPATDDLAARLKKLKASFDAKVISEGEYKAQRELILKEGGL
jgi:hypothetical protein